MSEGNMDGNDTPTRADVEALIRWTSLGDSGSVDRGGTEKTYSDCRIVISLSVSEAAQEVEELVRVREERHAEGQAKIMRSIGEALRLSHGRGVSGLREPERDRDIGEDEPQ